MFRILRIADVTKVTGLPASTIYRLANEGSFPKSIKLSQTASGWLESDLEAWLQARIAASPQAEAALGEIRRAYARKASKTMVARRRALAAVEPS